MTDTILNIITSTHKNGENSWKILNLSGESIPFIKCQLGNVLSSNLFNGNINLDTFTKLENNIKTKCNNIVF